MLILYEIMYTGSMKRYDALATSSSPGAFQLTITTTSFFTYYTQIQMRNIGQFQYWHVEFVIKASPLENVDQR